MFKTKKGAEFSYDLVAEKARRIKWDDRLSAEDNGGEWRVYVTAESTAYMDLSGDEGNEVWEYRGQRSLLFSHQIFSLIPEAFLRDEIAFQDVQSGLDEHPMLYFGSCFMTGLREQVITKLLQEDRGINNPDLTELREAFGKMGHKSDPDQREVARKIFGSLELGK